MLHNSCSRQNLNSNSVFNSTQSKPWLLAHAYKCENVKKKKLQKHFVIQVDNCNKLKLIFFPLGEKKQINMLLRKRAVLMWSTQQNWKKAEEKQNKYSIKAKNWPVGAKRRSLTFQRFPHSLHRTNVVIGSSALRVCTCKHTNVSVCVARPVTWAALEESRVAGVGSRGSTWL